MIIGLLGPIHLSKGLIPSTFFLLVFFLLHFSHLFPDFLFPLCSFLLKLILLMFHLILDSLTNQRIGISPLDILDMKIPKILSIS